MLSTEYFLRCAFSANVTCGCLWSGRSSQQQEQRHRYGRARRPTRRCESGTFCRSKCWVKSLEWTRRCTVATMACSALVVQTGWRTQSAISSVFSARSSVHEQLLCWDVRLLLV